MKNEIYENFNDMAKRNRTFAYSKGRKAPEINKIDKKITSFSKRQTEILDGFKIKPLIRNFCQNDLKKRQYPKQINKSCPLFKNNNFILSDQALEKCNKVYHYMIYQVPCILEGETGTSKSFTASMMAQYRQWQIIEDEKEEEKKTGRKKDKYTEFKLFKFSLSKETKISDLFGKYSGSADSLDGITMTYGPFIEAFSEGEGHCLLLDEINLAPISVLQCIEEAIDTGVLSIEITGLPLKKFIMKPNFCLIATQNRRTKFYKDKRESAGIKFLSKFQIVNFEELGREELIKIAKGIRNNLSEQNKGNVINDEEISKLVDFHIEWNKSKESDFICFTIRQINSCIEAYFTGENMYNIIYNIYGKTHDQLEKFENLIQKYFPKNDIILDLPKGFPNCFQTNSIKKVFQQVDFAFNNGSNVIITGKRGCGKTQFALYMAEYYNNKIFPNDKSSKNNVDFMICTEETSCSDIIGKQILTKKEESGLTMIEWKYGFLLEGVKAGKCLVLDNINEVNSQVTERANNLFDLNFNSKEKLYFDIPENPNKEEQKVEINKNFRVIATCEEDKLNNMTPAFLNRFKIIYLEDQLKDLELKGFIKHILDEEDKKMKDTEMNADKNNEKSLIKEKTKTRINPRYRRRAENNDTNLNKEKEEEKKRENEKEKEKEKLIPELYNKIIQDNKNILNSISILSLFIKSVYIFKSEFKKIENKIIVDYILQLINPEQKKIIIDDSIYNTIRNLLIENDKNTKDNKLGKVNKYFFKDSKELCSFLINAYSSYLIHNHMRFEGPTGIGKTEGACALARFIAKEKKFYIQSFHSGTKPSQCYGGSTIINNQMGVKDGLLTLAMKEGTVFIADEFNLSSKETMKSILPSLSHLNEYQIYIPGIETKIKINKNFIFIACQNKVGTLGRNKLPDLIDNSLREFTYPSHIKKTSEEIKQIENDVESICLDINKSLKEDNKDKVKKYITDPEAKNIGKFMLKFNQLNKNYIQPLSFRDIKKIFRRVYYQRNKSNNEIFIGFEVYHNIIFYILSKLNSQNIIDIKQDLVKLITDIFPISLEKEKNLDIYFEKSLKLTKEGKNKIFLIKGLCKVNLNINFTDKMKKRILSYFNLQNFLNPFFNAIISSEDEPLLFLGKTSCKTYLCQTLFLDEFEIIHLNQETNINQLLGGLMVLSKKEAEYFYFKYLCDLCGKSKNLNKLYSDYKENKLSKNKFSNSNPRTKGFEIAINNFKKILFDNKNDKEQKEDEQDFLSNYIIVFKPGFILDSLIKDKPFVLKDISNLHSDVLERFNQFLTEEQKIVLIEDIYNTFTDDEDKEIIFNSSNRILATANDGYENKLSEAILSRFTVINVESYEFEEEKIIINMLFKNSIDNNKNQKEEINQIIKLLREIESTLKLSITLAQKNKIITIIDKLKNSKEMGENLNISEIVLFNIFKGLFEFRTNKSKKFNSFKNLFKSKKLWNYEEDKSTLSIEVINNINVIKSHNSKLYIERPDSKENPSNDIAFTEKFCENIDIIHFAIKLNLPLILEGMQGQGKKTALNYIFKLLNIKDSNIINIYLSENTKKEDLLGKITATADNENIKVDFIQTDLLKALINEKNEDYAIIFHNINKASPGIFEILENIFDYSKESILLPNGENIRKNDKNPSYLFGIFDSENGKINRNSLPKFILRTCIYFIVQNPNGGDIHKIITSKFRQKKYKLESNYFEDKFLEASQIQNNYTLSDNMNPLSLNDINKFISFRDITYKKLDISIISQFIFVYRHTESEKIQEIIKQLKFKAFNFVPKFSFKNQSLLIEIEENEAENEQECFQRFSLNLRNEFIDKEEIQRKLNTLTKPQKHCLLFLSCSILTNCSIILQGNTNSGKTHLITLFSEMIGKKLHIYQMNKDTNLTMFFGQSSIRELNYKEKNEIHQLYKDLSNIIEYKKIYNIWNPLHFSEFCKALEDYTTNNDNEEVKKKYKRIKELISLTRRFESKPSPFCEALTNGDWILIEQIESAPNDIIEKLIPLCEEKPELKIIKGTEEITYKLNNNDLSKSINKDFRIFFTFNPYNRDKKMHPSLFSKCIVFTLPQIDSTSEYCSKIYFGKLKNINYPVDLSKQLSGRLSSVHKIAKEDSIKYNLKDDNIDNDNLIFTGRTIKFISNELTNLDKNKMKYIENITPNYLNNIIHSTFEHYYFNSFVNSKKEENFKKIKDDFINSFAANPPKFETEDDDLNIIYNDICQDLQFLSLYKENKNNGENYNFKLANFLNKCLIIKFRHLKDIIIKMKYIKFKDNNLYFDIFQGYQTIIKFLESINQIIQKINFPIYFSRLIISDPKLLEYEKTKISCSKIVLYNQLLKESLIVSENIIPENLIVNIFQLSKHKSFIDFKTLISNLNKYPNLFDKFNKLFPFYKVVNEKELTGEKEDDGESEENLIKKLKYKNSILVLWLDLFYIYWKKNINFTIIIDNEKYEFKFDKKNNSILNPCFSFNLKSKFFLTDKSYFFFINEDNKEQMHKIQKVSRYESYLFYQFLYKFSDYKNYIPTYEQFDEVFNITIDETEELSLFKKFKKKKKNNFDISWIFGRIKQNKNNKENQIALNEESDEEIDDEDDNQKENHITPVTKVLTLFFNYSKNFFDFIKNEYFNNIEKEIYELLLENFDEKLKGNDYIIYSDIIRALDIYFNNYFYLFDEVSEDILNNTKERNLRLQNINKALENIKEIQNKFIKFNFKSLITILNGHKEKIEKINEKNINELEKQEVIDSLDNYKNKKNQKLIENAKVKIKTLEPNFVRNWKEVAITPKKEVLIYNNNWPKIRLSFENDILNNYNKDFEKHKKFIDVLLRYCEIKKILDENLIDNKINNNNFFKMLLQLSEYDEMRNISNYIFNEIKIDNDYLISPKYIRMINSFLNISFIKNLSEFCYNKKENQFSFKIVRELFSYCNDLIYRKIDKNEIQYIISNYSNKYEPNFKISFPKFKGFDLIFLFVDFNDNCEIVESFLIKDIKLRNTYLKRLVDIELNSDDNDFNAYLDMIIKIIFEELNYGNYANKLDFLKNLLKNDKDVEIKKLCKLIISIYDKKEFEILQNVYNFDLNDIEIYKYTQKNKFVEKMNFTKYPSLVFFMLDYNFDANKLLIGKYEDNTKVEDFKDLMPFWLFCLRYFSSIECIISKETNYFSKIIDNFIRQHLRIDLRKKQKIRTINNWLNLVCHDNKIFSYEPLYEKIKLFLYALSKDDFFLNIDNKTYINKTINNICEDLIKNVIENIFKDNNDSSLKNYYVEHNDNELTNFLKNPNKFLFQKITDDIISILSKEIENEKNKNIINRIINNIKDILNFKEEELKLDIENELRKKNEENKELNLIKGKEKIEKMLKSIVRDLNTYNNLINELKEYEDFDFEIQLKVKELLKLNDSLTKYNKLFSQKNNKLEIIKVYYNLKRRNSIIVKNSDGNIIYENSKFSGEFYLPSKNPDYSILNKKDSKPFENLKVEEEKVILSSLVFSGSKEKNYEKFYSNINDEQITLVFGEDNTIEKFYKNFSYYKKKLKDMSNCFLEILNKKNLISNCNFDKLNKKIINNFSNICNVKFSDDKKCEKISKALENIKKNLLQINIDYNYISERLKEIFENLEINTKYNQKILKYDYELRLISDKKIFNDNIIDFSQMKENNILSVPIINVDSQIGEIFCSYNELNINIDPIYPSLFNEPYKILIMTISNISLSIDKEEKNNIIDDRYIIDSIDDYIKVDNIIEKNKPIEMYLKIPKIKNLFLEKEIHILNFNLEISCNQENELKKNNINDNKKIFKLPINIRMNLMPIIIKIVTKNKKLKLKDNNFLINDELYAEEEIILYLQQIQLNTGVKLKSFIQIEGLEGNNSIPPIVTLSEENETTKLSIAVPKNGDKKYSLKANINLFYAEKIKFSIGINSILLDFDYQLKVFDFDNKKYIDGDLTLKHNFLEKLQEKKTIKLYMKFIFPEGLKDLYEGRIYFKNEFENLIQILNKDEIEHFDLIKNNTIIEIELDINSEVFNLNKIPTIKILSDINDIDKECNIIFINEDSDIDILENIDINNENQLDDHEATYYFVEQEGIFLDIDYNKKKDKNIEKIEDIYIKNEKEFNNIKIQLPELVVPNSPFSFKDIDDFYSLCIKIIRTLPSYIQYSLKINNKDNIIQAKKIFLELLGYYKLYPLNQKDNSFLHEKIDAFKKSYKDLAKRLFKSGMKLKKSNLCDLFGIYDFEFEKDDIQNEFIIQPKQINLDITEIKNEEFFKIKDIEEEIDFKQYLTEDNRSNRSRNISNLSKYEMGNFLTSRKNLLSSFREDDDNLNLDLSQNEYFEEGESNAETAFMNLENYKKTISSDILYNINLGSKEYIQKLKEEEQEEQNIPQNHFIIRKENENIGYIIDEDTSKTIQINQEKFENYNFTEKNGIQWVTKKIEKIDKNMELNLSNTQGYLPKNLLTEVMKKNIQYRILELSPHIMQLSNKTFNEVSKLIGPEAKTDIHFNNICVIFLIDGSCYISLKRKIINFYILCSYSIACHLLEIPYGIALIADGKFKVILKQFEEPHSFDILEKVYECLMIRRFRDNLSCSQKFAKETFMFSEEYNPKENEIPKFYKEHQTKIIITITDGLDEELKLTKKWRTVIFNDPNVSFGFIFNKPDFGNIEDKKKIEKLWENFIEESKKAKSRVIVHIFERINNNNFYNNLSIFFRDLILQKQEKFEEKNILININKPDFVEEKIYLNSIQTLNEISFKSRKGKNSNNQLYIQNYPLKFSFDGFYNEKIKSYEKNKLGQICQGTLDKNIENTFKTFIDSFIIKYNELDRMSLEKIFKKNKASQKVLSTTGSEIDIISLVISILNKEPRPKIFWEETGEMKRQYSVSIIIDNSISCFGDISREHSFKILRELLSPLFYLDISKFDIILTTNNSPIILCSDLNSQKCLKSDSALWIGLFKYLQAPYYGSDLSSAINFAYNLNRERNECTKRIFVLTDGLFEKREQMCIRKQIQNCSQLDMNIIGIGIGSYPIGIENIFEKVIYTMEPSNLLLGLSGFFEQIHMVTTEKIIGFEYQANNQEIHDIIRKLSSNKKVHYSKLIDELKKIEVNYTTFEYFNKPVILDKSFANLNEAINPEENENTLMLEKNFLLGKKILIVMLWSYEMNKSNESEQIIPENLFRSKKMNVYTKDVENLKGKPCVESAVDIFGLKIFVVLDYENAIKELTRNVKGKCDYNSVWIMCGPQKAVLPNPKSDPNLIEEFMKVINIFWKKGGSLVFFADGDPLFYQVNLFLENAEFPIDDEDDDFEENNFDKTKMEIPRDNEYDRDEIKDTEVNIDKNEIIISDNEEEDEREKEESDNEKEEKIDEIYENERRSNEDKEEEEEEINLNQIKFVEKEIKKIKKVKEKILKANFRIAGSHLGKNTLLCDRTGLLDKKTTFNGANNTISNLKRPNIGTNLYKIYEGVTISYAENIEDKIYSIFDRLGLSKVSAKERYSENLPKKNKNPIYPFIPFAKDSEGGISIMIYYGRGCGDVVIDCGFTKCFLEMEEQGTLRYIRNLSAVTSRCDVLMKEGEDPQIWKPDFIDYKLDLSKNYFWKYYHRKVYIIDVEKPVSKNDRLYIFEEITKELYSEYNNIIYFYNNGIQKIKLEDIKKENSLIPKENKQNNLKQIADSIINECNEKFGNNYNIEIYSDGYCKNIDNKLMDYILSNDAIDLNRRSFQLLPEIEINISAEFTQETLDKLDNIKTIEELNSNYKDIRNSLVFLPYQYLPNVSLFKIKSQLEKIKDNILEQLKAKKANEEFKKRMEILLFYAILEVEDVGFNTAAFKDQVKIEN